MTFKNFEGIEYTVNYVKPAPRYSAEGLCDNPKLPNPQIVVDPNLLPRRQLNVLIEEVFHAYFYNLPEKKARKFASSLGKLVYNKFIKK